MHVLYPVCCGLDVHKKEVVACLLRQPDGAPVSREIRRFGTMTTDLLGLLDWLRSAGCTHVAMESTGVYWKPVYNILEGRDIMIFYQSDRDWHYRKEERRWVTLNDRSSWRKVERVERRTRASVFHIS